jgi:hypothetical protein
VALRVVTEHDALLGLAVAESVELLFDHAAHSVIGPSAAVDVCRSVTVLVQFLRDNAAKRLFVRIGAADRINAQQRSAQHGQSN